MTTFRFKLLTEINLVSLESNAQTFAELKADIANSPLAEKISFGRTTEVRDGQEWTRTIKLIERNTRAEFGSVDDARLPAGDVITFFVTPLEHKGGSEDVSVDELVDSLYRYDIDEVKEILEEWGYNQLRSFGSKLNKKYDADISLHGLRGDVLDNVLDWVEDYLINLDQDDEPTIEEPTVLDLIVVSLGLLSSAVILLQEQQDSDSNCGELSELHEKALELQRLLNK